MRPEPPKEEVVKFIPAQWENTCPECKETIYQGQFFAFFPNRKPGMKAFHTWCAGCPTPEWVERSEAARDDIKAAGELKKEMKKARRSSAKVEKALYEQAVEYRQRCYRIVGRWMQWKLRKDVAFRCLLKREIARAEAKEKALAIGKPKPTESKDPKDNIIQFASIGGKA